MAEEADGSGSSPDTGGLAIDLAIEEARGNPALQDRVGAFLDDQRSLIGIQKRHLHEQITHLDLGIWEKRLGIALRLATLVVGIAVATGFGLMVWDAAHANGLVVDEFTVPPELAARGLSGQVVAGQLLSDLLSLQARSSSVRAASSYANNWGNNLKVEIPETGISIGELTRFLRQWLGHETHISGAVIRTATGIEVRASAGSDAFAPRAGAEADLDALVQGMAETIYGQTQPYRYAIYIYASGRLDEGEAALRALAARGAPEDRYWANNGLISLYNTEKRFDDATRAAQDALALRPGALVSNFFLTRTNMISQREGRALVAAQATVAAMGDSGISEQGRNAMQAMTECNLARLQGDFLGSMGLCDRVLQLPDAVSVHEAAFVNNLLNAADLHDAVALRAGLATLRASIDPQYAGGFPALAALNELRLGHGSATMLRLVASSASESPVRLLGARLPLDMAINSLFALPAFAYATALSGDMKGAHAIIDPTPGNCSPCLRARGRIATLEKNWGTATYWFERAVQDAPSTPFAFHDWGRMLLAKGEADSAIAQFTSANRKGPKFADPLEGWGEALMAKNQSHLALAKFAEAEKYAPNWGRLHLKWGEALVYVGKPDEAKAKFSRAAQLDLTPAEKAELARVRP